MALIQSSSTMPWTEKRITQAAIEAIIALENAQKAAQREIDKIRGELIESLQQNADTEPGAHMVSLQESIRGGCLVKELLIW